MVRPFIQTGDLVFLIQEESSLLFVGRVSSISSSGKVMVEPEECLGRIGQGGEFTLSQLYPSYMLPPRRKRTTPIGGI